MPKEVSADPVPITAGVALMNITVLRPSGAGYVTAYECGNPSNTSTLNFTTGTRAHLSLVRLSHARTVCIRSSAATGLIVDLVGWYATAGESLRVGYASTSGCSAMVNPPEWTVQVFPVGGTIDDLRLSVTGGTAPYTMEVHDYSGWSHTIVTDVYDEYWNVHLVLHHPASAAGSYPMNVVVHDSSGAQVSTLLTEEVTATPALC